MRGSHSCFLRHRAGRRAPHLRSTHSTARLPTGREAQPPAKQQVSGRAVQSQVRKENSSLRGWAGPGWNPDSGCPLPRASVGLPPNSSQAQSTMGLPPSRGARTALRSHSGPATRSRLGRRLPGARGPGPGPVSGVTPGAEQGARGPCPLRASSPERRSSPESAHRNPGDRTLYCAAIPQAGASLRCSAPPLTTHSPASPPDHKLSESWCRRGRLLFLPPAPSSSSSVTPLFWGGLLLPCTQAGWRLPPYPPASSWRALDPEPANQQSPSLATVTGSETSTRPKSWGLIKLLGRGILSIAGCEGEWHHAGVAGGHVTPKQEAGAVKLVPP